MAREMIDSGISWIGNMPSDWGFHRMKSCIADRMSGAWGNEAADNEGDMICLRIADFDYAKFRFKDTPIDELTIRNYEKKTIESLLLQKGDILIEKSGGGEKSPVGRTVIFDKEYPALYANFMDRLRCTNIVTSDWMQYVFVTFYKNEYSRNYIKQTTGIQNLDLTAMLANERIPVPTLPEQERIANFLDTECSRIDSVIEKTRASIEEYKKLKQSVITQAVTKGIRPNREMKDSGIEWIGEIPKEWNKAKLKWFCKRITDGSHFSPESIAEGYPYITAKDIRGIGINYDYANKISQDDFLALQKNGCQPHKGDVLIVKDGATTGRVGLMNDDVECVLLSSVAMLSPAERIESLFLMYVLQSDIIQKQISISMAGSAMPRITLAKLVDYYGVYCPSEEQKEICSFLKKQCEEMDSLILKKEISLKELESYKKSLIFEYVTGKKEVPA